MPQLNATLEEVVRSIDWAQLREQKGSLAYTIVEAVEQHNAVRVNALTGLLHLIDAIQDAAVTECIATAKEVFNLPEGS